MTVDADTTVQQIFCAICGQGTGEFTDDAWPTDPRCEGCRDLPDPYPIGRAQREPDRGLTEDVFAEALAPENAPNPEITGLRNIVTQNTRYDPDPGFRFIATPPATEQPAAPTIYPLDGLQCVCGETGCWDVVFRAEVWSTNPAEHVTQRPGDATWQIPHSRLTPPHGEHDYTTRGARVVCYECGQELDPQPQFRILYGQ